MVIIVRYSEIGIKGDNRGFFEDKLVDNIKKSGFKFDSIVRKYGRIIIYTDERPNLRAVFGISSFSFAEELDIDFSKLAEKCVGLLKGCKTFSISCQRLDKSLPFTSVDFCKRLAELIISELHLKVDLSNADKTLFFELIDNKAYFFTEKFSGFDGLPLCSQGDVLCYVDSNNSVLASLLMMKRGCRPVIFRKDDFDIGLIEKFAPGIGLKVHDVKNIEDIDDFKEYRSSLLVLGQNLKVFSEISSGFIVLRPLIGFNDDEIKVLLDEYERA